MRVERRAWLHGVSYVGVVAHFVTVYCCDPMFATHVDNLGV